MTKHYPIAIIGGGISGSSFAHFAAQRGYKSIILEKCDKLGGCIETCQSPKAGDFWLELGAHTIYNSYATLIQFCQDNALLSQLQTRRTPPFKLLTRQNIVASVLGSLNPVRAGIGLPLFKFSKAKERTVAEYFSFVFGHNNYHKTLRYCFDAVLCQDSQNFPADFLFKPRVKNKKLPRSFTFKGGMSSLFKDFSNLDIDINLNSEVHHIDRQNNSWLIETQSEVIKSDKLILATPWHITQKLLAQINHPIASIAHQPGISRLTTSALIFDKDKLRHIKPLSGLIGIEQNFFSMVTRDVVPHEKFRGMTIHFKEQKESHTKLIDEFLSKLNIPKSAVIDVHSKYNTLPCYQAKHQRFLDVLDQVLSKDTTLGLTGNYFTRLAIEDCVMRSFLESKRLFDI